MNFLAQTGADEFWRHLAQISPMLIFVVLIMMIKIIKVFTLHQQKMAEILNRSAHDETEITAMRRELADLTSLVRDHVINSDGQRSLAPPPTPSLNDRLQSNT